MLPNIFQTSIPIIPADSLDLKGSAEKFVEKVTTTPADVLLKELGNDALQFGLKVLAALAIYFI